VKDGSTFTILDTKCHFSLCWEDDWREQPRPLAHSFQRMACSSGSNRDPDWPRHILSMA